jgi:two-component system, cell cycle response regulator DivK
MDQTKKILVVDDDPRNIFALRLTLTAKGFTCICAQEAKEGINIIQKHPGEIGLVLMDMMMPGMDGYGAIAALKADRRTAGIPVVAVTAQAMTGDKEKCIGAGAVAYLAKPIDVDQMLTIIHAYFK